MNGFDIKKPYLEHKIPLGQCRDIYGVCFLMVLFLLLCPWRWYKKWVKHLFSFYFVIIRPNQGGFTWIQFINIAFGIIMAHLIFLWILKFFLFLLSCSIWLQICLLERMKLKTTIEFKNNIKKQHWGTWRGRNQFVFNIFLSSSKFPRIPWRYPFLCVKQTTIKHNITLRDTPFKWKIIIIIRFSCPIKWISSPGATTEIPTYPSWLPGTDFSRPPHFREHQDNSPIAFILENCHSSPP